MKTAKASRVTTAFLDSPRISALFDKVHAVTDPEPLPKRQRVPWFHSAVVGLLAAGALIGWFDSGARTPAMHLELPGGINAANTVRGHTVLLEGAVVRAVELDALAKLDLLKGSAAGRSAGADGNVPPQSGQTDARLAYAALGNLFTVALEPRYALWALNLLLYGLCAVLVGGSASALFADPAKSLLAATLFVFSVVVTVSVGELSPHLLGTAFYFLWILVLLQAENTRAPVNWLRTVGLSALLGVWSLADASAAFGLGVYAFVLLKRDRPLHLVLPVLAWLGFPALEREIAAHAGVTLQLASPAGALWQGLQDHWLHLSADPVRYCGYLSVEAVNFFVNDSPLTVLAAVLGLCVLRHKSKWLLWAGFVVPIAICLIIAPTMTGRGSALGGSTIVIFVAAAHAVVEAGRQIRCELGSKVAAAPVLFIVLQQFAWGHASEVGWFYPARASTSGIFNQAGALMPTEFASMTGAPTAVNGTALERGPSVFPARRLEQYKNHWSGLHELVVEQSLQTPIFAAALVAAWTLLGWRKSLLLAPLALTWIASAQLWGSAAVHDWQSLGTFDGRIALADGEKLVARIKLSDQFREKLQQAARRNASVEFAWNISSRTDGLKTPCELQVDEWSFDRSRFTVPAAAFLSALEAHQGRVELSISPKAGSNRLAIHSWQALRASGGHASPDGIATGREASVIRADGSRQPIDWFPSFEIRVVRGDNAYPFKSLIEQFHPAPPTGYVLVGF